MDDPTSHAAQQRDGGSIFDEIRRQMEEMLGGNVRPPRPTVLPGVQAPRPGRASQDHAGLAMSATAAYWLLPLAAGMAKKRRKRRRARAEQQAKNEQQP